MCNRTQRNHRPLPRPDPFRVPGQGRPTLRSLRLRHTLTRCRMTPNLRVCQLVKVSPRGKVLHICRQWSPTTPASGSTDPHVRGDRSVSRARRLYRIPRALSRASRRTEVPLPETRITYLTVGLPPREEDAHLPLRNPTIIAHRHYYVKCLGQRVLALGCCGSWRPLQQPEESGALLRTMSST